MDEYPCKSLKIPKYVTNGHHVCLCFHEDILTLYGEYEYIIIYITNIMIIILTTPYCKIEYPPNMHNNDNIMHIVIICS